MNKSQRICTIALLYSLLKEIFLRRKSQGAFFNLIEEMRSTNTEKYFNYRTIPPTQFEEVLSLVGPDINRLYLNREPISSAQRLACTLRLFSFAKRKVHTSTYQNTFKEVYIPVPWGTIAGKWWGSTNTKPILCFHGIQDNCGTFDRLIPTLNGNAGISFLCLDFPGHGYSSPFPKGMFYDFLSYPILIKRICEYFNWLTISLMGHSLGAIVSFVYTMLYPEKVNFLMCIDALKPIHNPMSAEEIRRSIDNFLKYEKFGEINEPLTYTLEEMIQKIANKNSVNSEYVPFILKRNISVSKKDPSKYYFIRDPVVKLRIMFNWPQEQLVKDASRITCPVLICKSKQISYFEPKENFNRVLDVLKGSSIDCVFHILDGTHHLHLNEPQTIGDLIKYFLNKHYTPEKIHLNENDTVFCKSRCNSQSTKI